MALVPASLGSDFVSDGSRGDGLFAEGSITYNPTNKTVTIEGTEQYNDNVNIVYDTRGTTTQTDDQINIRLANVNSPLIKAFNYADVVDVIFNGYGGDDFVDNKVLTRLKAYGGAGNDTLLGGFGNDILQGGANNDYIDGRRGADTIRGEAGTDALFGDDGNDTIFGGLDSDWIHGGNGIDSLNGEGGNDWIFGGAGADTVTDNSGTNQKFADYSTYTSTITGFYHFDWFDKNLQDPDLRSAVRLVYRDNFLMRDDLLKLFQQVSTDNQVNTAELADLRDLMSTQLTTPVDSRFLLGRVVNGDRANGWYHGATLGNLAAGASAVHLNKLVDKWFMGGDLPAVSHPSVITYQRIFGTLFVNGPTFDDVNQDGVGDCYLMAALGAVAKQSPSTIQNMFVDNGNGTYSVRFFKGTSAFYVTVNSMLPVDAFGNSEYAEFEDSSGPPVINELWVALAEKAYAQLNESGWIDQDGTNSYLGIELGWPKDAFSHITGKAVTDNMFFVYDPGIGTYVPNVKGLFDDLAAGKAITLATKGSGVDSDVVSGHAYILVGYDSQTKKFELYNPHGTNATLPVTLNLTWSQLVDNCDYWTSVKL